MKAHLTPIHPGEVLAEDFPSPIGMSQYRLAKQTGVLPRRINAVVHSPSRNGRYSTKALTCVWNLSAVLVGNSIPFELDIENDKLGDQLD